MALRLSLLSLALLSAAATAGPVPKVVNGTAAPITDYPWMFHLVSGDPARPRVNDHGCGGAYLGDGIAVTARHCVLPTLTAGGWYGCIGNSLSANRNNCFPVVAAVRHEGPFAEGGIAFGNGSYGTGDMALVRLSGVPAGLPFMTLPTAAEDASVASDEPLTVIGYGSTRYESYEPSPQLRQYTLARDSNAACANRLGITETEMGADLLCLVRTPSGAAPGDSGSPLLMSRNGALVPVALVTSGNDFTSYFVRYAPYRDWFAAQLAMDGWQDETKRPVDLVMVSGESQTEALITVHNWSNQPQPLTASLRAADSPFAVDTSGCDEIAALASCQLRVTVDGPVDAMLVDTLQVQVGDQVSYYPLNLVPAATALNSPLAELSLTATSGWQATADGMSLHSDGAWASGQMLTDLGHSAVAMVEGPLHLAMNVRSITDTGMALTLMVDGQPHARFSGDCSSTQIGLSLDSGRHQIEWRGPRGYAEVYISELAVVDAPVASSQPQCVKHVVIDLPDGTVEADGNSGGGSWGIAGLLTLALLGWRRRR